MPVTEIFIEKSREVARLQNKNDIKRRVLENQEIVKKRCIKHSQERSKKIGGFSPLDNRPFLFLVKQVFPLKRIVLLVVIFMVAFFSFIPFYINISTISWEKNRRFFYEEDPLTEAYYKQKLIKSIESGVNDTGGDYTNLPLLKVINYTVKKGDSLYRIARSFRITVDTIITANEIKNGASLKVGKTLRIPNISGIFYTVKRGDSLYSISKKYGVSITRIADINDLSSSKIVVGQKIFIPGGKLSDWDRAVALGEVFRRPAYGRLTSTFGFRKDPFTGKIAFHAGIDIANAQGTPVYAAQSGKVIYAGYYGSYGRTVIIQHPNGYKTLYAHLYKIYTKRGRYVTQGQKIALMGNTGRSTGPHLHFEVHHGRKIINPLKLTKLR